MLGEAKATLKHSTSIIPSLYSILALRLSKRANGRPSHFNDRSSPSFHERASSLRSQPPICPAAFRALKHEMRVSSPDVAITGDSAPCLQNLAPLTPREGTRWRPGAMKLRRSMMGSPFTALLFDCVAAVSTVLTWGGRFWLAARWG